MYSYMCCASPFIARDRSTKLSIHIHIQGLPKRCENIKYYTFHYEIMHPHDLPSFIATCSIAGEKRVCPHSAHWHGRHRTSKSRWDVA